MDWILINAEVIKLVENITVPKSFWQSKREIPG